LFKVRPASRFWGGAGQLEGKGAVVSEERKLNIMMKFPNEYKGEQFMTDGDQSYIAATTSAHPALLSVNF